MSEKFRKKVNKPVELFATAKKNIQNMEPESKGGKVAKGAGIGMAGFFQFLAWATKYTLLDNAALRKFEKEFAEIQPGKNQKGDDKKFSAFLKKYPNFSAHILYYLILTGVVAGGVKVVENSFQDNVKDKKEKKINEVREVDNFKVDPTAENDVWKKQMLAIRPYNILDIIQSEGMVYEMYSDVSQKTGYQTIGSGFMIGKVNPKGDRDRAIIKEKKDFFKSALGRPLVNGTTISNYENQVLVTAWLEKRIYPTLKKRFSQPIDASLFRALVVVAYNRGEGVFNKGQDGYAVREAINRGDSTEEIVKQFSDFFVKGNAGLIPKYGIEAHKVLGNITDEDVLNSLANAPYKLNGKKMWDGKSLKLDYGDNIAADLLKIKNADIYKNGRIYKQLPVKEYMTQGQIDTILMGKLFAGNTLEITEEFIAKVEQDKKAIPENVLKSQALNEEGESLYASGKYKNAVKKFEEAIATDSHNYIVYSNISIACYKAGDYESGLKIVQDLIQSKHIDHMPDDIKAYTYYNAGLNREALGDQAKDSAEKLEHYKKAQQNVRIAEKISDGKYEAFDTRIKQKMDDVSKQKQGTGNKNKKISFNSAGDKLNKKHNVKNTNTVYELLNTTERMA